MKLQTERDCVKYSLMAEVRMTCTQVSVKIKSDDVMLIDTILFFFFAALDTIDEMKREHHHDLFHVCPDFLRALDWSIYRLVLSK